MVDKWQGLVVEGTHLSLSKWSEGGKLVGVAAEAVGIGADMMRKEGMELAYENSLVQEAEMVLWMVDVGHKSSLASATNG